MNQAKPRILIIGAGFVADLYIGSLRLYPDIVIAGVYDRDPARRAAFCAHWNLAAADSFEALLGLGAPGDLVLNLTNPGSHFEVSRACLEAGYHVYSEKPLAMRMDQAEALVDLAAARGLRIASAPCSFLGQAAQTLWTAVRENVAGQVRLVYAEMDDDFIPQAAYRKWVSESGAPWPYRDEFEVGCTLEHAGYYLAWLLPIFGPVRTVVAASAELIPKDDITPERTPDFSVGTLFFESGVVARLTCSIVAPHDHGLKIIGDRGVIEMTEAWNNAAAPRFRRRFTLRRRLVTAPIARVLKLSGPTHPMARHRRGSPMNFALGPVEMLDAIAEARPCRLSPELSLHVNEVTLALQNAGEQSGAIAIKSRFAPVAPMPWARNLKGRAMPAQTAELSIGIIGTGFMAGTIATLIGRREGARVDAVLSHSRARAADFAARHGAAWSGTEITEFLGRRPDAVYVGSGNAAHFEAVRACLEAGIPVLVEKPMTTASARTAELIALARERGVLLVENLWTLALPSHRKLHDLMHGGELGAPRQMTFDLSTPLTPEGFGWVFDKESGGVLLDRAVYGLAPALDLLGPVASMSALLARNAEGVDVSATLQLDHDSGAQSLISLSVVRSGANALDLGFDRGNARIAPSLGGEWVEVSRIAPVGPRAQPGAGGLSRLKASLRALPALRRVVQRPGGSRSFHPYGADPYQPMLEHFLKLVADGRTESDIAPLSLSGRVMELIGQAREA